MATHFKSQFIFIMQLRELKNKRKKRGIMLKSILVIKYNKLNFAIFSLLIAGLYTANTIIN